LKPTSIFPKWHLVVKTATDWRYFSLISPPFVSSPSFHPFFLL
jgi:hypothetical protein